MNGSTDGTPTRCAAKITLYNAVLPVNVEVTTFAAENLHDVASIASFGAPFDAIVPNGVKAWYVEQIQGDKVMLKALPEGHAIQAGSGVILTSPSLTGVFHMEKDSLSMHVSSLT